MKVCVCSSGTVSHALGGSEFGVLLKVNYEECQYTIWLPPAPAQFGYPIQSSSAENHVWLPSAPEMLCFNQHKRIATSGGSLASYQWQFQPNFQLIASPSSQVIESVKQKIYQKTGGYSLDYYAAGLVRGFGKQADADTEL